MLYYTSPQLNLHSHGTPFPQKRLWRPSHSAITVSSGMDEIPSQNALDQRLKAAILPLDLPCSGLVTHSREILTTSKSHKNKPERLCIGWTQQI